MLQANQSEIANSHIAAMALLAIVFWISAAAPSVAQDFQTLDYQGYPTTISGVSGNFVVGTFADSNGIDHGVFGYGSPQLTLNYPGTNLETVASGISGSNVVGTYYTVNSYGGADAFEYNGSSYKSVDCPLGYSTMANGISGNNIVGTCDYDSADAFGFFYNGSTYKSLIYPSASRTEANGVSGLDVVGTYSGASGSGGFLYNGSTYKSLNFPGATYTEAFGISGNYIVGAYSTTPVGFQAVWQGFIYNSSTSAYTAFNDPLGAEGTIAYGTDGVSVVGSYRDSTGTLNGFIVPIASIPEPTSRWLLAFGGTALLCRRRVSGSGRLPGIQSGVG